MWREIKRVLCLVAVASLVLGGAAPVRADHDAGYHWERTQNPYILRVVDSTTQPWKRYIRLAARDWSRARLVEARVVNRNNSSQARWNCPVALGVVRVCNGHYDRNGAIGWIELWLDRGHVQRARIRLNDTYARDRQWDLPRIWRHVACHELGHILGLDHRGSGETCLNNSVSIRVRSPQRPDNHDYRQLALMYRHLDGPASAADVGTAGHGAHLTKVTRVLPAT